MSERKSSKATTAKSTAVSTGKWSESATRVLRERYLKKNGQGELVETPDEMCWRVARAIAGAEAKNSGKTPEQIEKIAAGYADLMLSRRFMPNSPTLMNAGKGNNLQLSACFVIPVEDSLSGIFESVKHAAIVHQSGGGTGFSFSRLRPEGSHVASTHGVASGPVSFMRIFDQATDAVKQGGSRRGANMGILRVDHPDIEKFIDCKLTGGITNFNISVAITDTFMTALANNADFDLIDPHTQQVVRQMSARALMDRIISAAWSSGDPGLVFIDRANQSTANPVPEIEMLEATNPCVVGETRIATSKGLQRMDTLFASQETLMVATDARTMVKSVNGRDHVVGDTIFHTAMPVFQTGTQVTVRKLITSHGIEITATPNHRFLTTQGYKRLDELEFDDELLLQSAEGAWSQDYTLPAVTLGIQSESRLKAKIAGGEASPPLEWSQELGEVLGYVVGDGYVRCSTTTDVVGIAIDSIDSALKDLLQERLSQWFGVQGDVTERQGHYQVQYAGTVATFLWALGLTTDHAAEKRVPESIYAAPREAVVGFLRGLFSADGSVQSSEEKGACSVRLATWSKGLAQDVQQLLLNFGIVSAIRLRREKMLRLLPNAQREPAEYATQAQYEVIIDKVNRDLFAETIGFMQARKQNHLTEWIAGKKRAANQETFITKIALIEDAGTADVFDTTEPVTHSVVFNGVISHNCGEQWLGPYDACNLGSINLGEFVRDGNIDWAGIETTVRECTRFLDDVIDINPYPLDVIRDKVQANRRIGLGVMGWADMLFLLGIRYDSDEAIALGERVMRSVRDWSKDESHRMADERGPFPNWKRSIYKDDASLRNATRTTVAPTGSISIIADCSSGIEPIFALAFQHRVKQPDGNYRILDFVNPFFLAALENSTIADKAEVLTYVKEHGTLHGHAAANDSALLAYVTAHEIAPKWHIKMQAAFQKGVDNSISKTINLPNEATLGDVEQAYMQAWELGCLGITVFRNGCKSEQVLNVGVKSATATTTPNAVAAPTEPPVVTAPVVEPTPAPAKTRRDYNSRGEKDRPEVVVGYTRQVRAPEGKVNVTLNSDEDGLLEVFVTIGKAGSDVSALAEALGRIISTHLRIESPISQDDRARAIAEQLRGIGGSTSIGFGMDRVRSLPDAVARAITQHLEQGSPQLPTAATRPQEQVTTNGNSTSSVALANGTGASPIGGMKDVQHYVVTGNLCPQCGCNTLVYEEGCKKCVACGHSEC